MADLTYISNKQEPDHGEEYSDNFQMPAANLWGTLGQNFPNYTDTLDDVWSPVGNSVFKNVEEDLWWYRFVDLSPSDNKQNIVSQRTVTSKATCRELEVLYGGYAGFNTDNVTLLNTLQWQDEYGNYFEEDVSEAATGITTWMSNFTSVDATVEGCGPRCAQILALQSANNLTATDPDVMAGDAVAVSKPRLWACNNTVGQVANTDLSWSGWSNPSALKLPDPQARYLAGALGWTAINSTGSDLQYVTFKGDTDFNPRGNATQKDLESLVMRFTVGAISAMDALGGPRQNLTGNYSPSPAQIVNVKWPYAGAILGGIPFIQFIMLLGVVWFSGKAIILEPSYLTAAHLLQPVLKKVGEDGILLSGEEMAARLGDYKIAYGVRPNVEDPGHHVTEFVRDLDVIEESEGYGYIRGKMPEGRYE